MGVEMQNNIMQYFHNMFTAYSVLTLFQQLMQLLKSCIKYVFHIFINRKAAIKS